MEKTALTFLLSENHQKNNTMIRILGKIKIERGKFKKAFFSSKDFIVWHPIKAGTKVKVRRGFLKQITHPKHFATKMEAIKYGEYLEY